MPKMASVLQVFFFFFVEMASRLQSGGFQNHETLQKQGFGCSRQAHDKNGRSLVSKKALKLENGAFLATLRPPNAGFKQKHAKNGLLSAGFSRRRPSRCRTEGVQRAKHYKNRGPETPKKVKSLGRRPLSEKVWVGLGLPLGL